MNRHLLPEEIDLLIDGEAGFGVAPLKAHVRQCADCQSELETAQAVATELDLLPHFAPAPLFADRVMQQVQVFEPWHVAAGDALRRLVPQSAPARVLAVGDSLRTDIAGAAGVDLASCWVLDGVHRAALSDGAGGFDVAKSEAEAEAAGLAPIATLPRFAW